MGQKYVIELEDKNLYSGDEIEKFVEAVNGKMGSEFELYFTTLHRVKGFNSLVFDDNGLKRLTPLSIATDAAHDEGYTHGYEQARSDFKKDIDEAYERGFKEGQVSSEKWGVPYKRGTEDGEERGRLYGMNDTWTAIEKLIRMSRHELEEAGFVLPKGQAYNPVDMIVKNYQASEVIKKLAEHEEKKAMQV